MDKFPTAESYWNEGNNLGILSLSIDSCSLWFSLWAEMGADEALAGGLAELVNDMLPLPPAGRFHGILDLSLLILDVDSLAVDVF